MKQNIVRRLEHLVETAGPGYVHQLIELFLQMGRQDFLIMKSALQSVDTEGFMAAAHNLKATSLNIGATELSEICAEGESHASLSSVIHAKNILVMIETELSDTENFLRGYVKESTRSA